MTRVNIKHSKDVEFKDIDVGGFFTIRNALYLKVSNDYLKPNAFNLITRNSFKFECYDSVQKPKDITINVEF